MSFNIAMLREKLADNFPMNPNGSVGNIAAIMQ